MPIEFDCPVCRVRIRTPDDSAGKSARCPGCGAVSVVPLTAVANMLDPPPQAVAADFSGNPFGERIPPNSNALNPYATPAELHQANWQTPLTIDQVRARLLGPAIGMFLFGLAGLGFMALAGIGFAMDPNQAFRHVGNDPAQMAGANGFFIGYFIFGLLSRLVQIVGATAMWRVRNYSLALAGAVCALVPCDVYCCLPCLPFGIWGLIVLNNAAVKAAFR